MTIRRALWHVGRALLFVLLLAVCLFLRVWSRT